MKKDNLIRSFNRIVTLYLINLGLLPRELIDQQEFELVLTDFVGREFWQAIRKRIWLCQCASK